MKPVTFLGDSLAVLRAFPEAARAEAGFQLSQVQQGREPVDWKPMQTVGAGVREIRVREIRVREIRVRDSSGAYRVIYLATLPDRVLVLHAFQKKTQATLQRDLELAARRLRQWRQ